MKHFIALIVFFGVSATAFANNTLPFNIIRDQNGKLVKIVIDHKKKAVVGSEEFLNEFKYSISQASKSVSIDRIEMEGYLKLSKKQQKAYLDSLDSLKQKSVSAALDDEKVKLELDKIIELLTKDRFFVLLADPNNPKAFDYEIVLSEAVKNALSAAGQVLGTTPIFSVLEFLVSEYIESLTSQREFYQNALLAYVNSGDDFTAEEAALIKSSIFYSRLGLTKLSSRKNAIKQWPTFGLKSEKEANKKCVAGNATSFHYCFKFEKTLILNLVDKSNVLAKSSSVSTAFDYKKPGFIGQVRWFILAAKLGLKLLPAPGLVKAPVTKWLESLYKKQRRTEGLLFSAATLQNDLTLADWILENTANPLIH